MPLVVAQQTPPSSPVAGVVWHDVPVREQHSSLPQSAGLTAEQLSSHWIVPELVAPHSFGSDSHESPKSDGFATHAVPEQHWPAAQSAGWTAEHSPSHWIVPELVAPHSFGGDSHESPKSDGSATHAVPEQHWPAAQCAGLTAEH